MLEIKGDLGDCWRFSHPVLLGTVWNYPVLPGEQRSSVIRWQVVMSRHITPRNFSRTFEKLRTRKHTFK
eukprot:1321623-Amorphochlora_amoeboformis.AAC.1